MKEIARFDYRGTVYRLVFDDKGTILNQVQNKSTLEFAMISADELIRKFAPKDNMFFLEAVIKAAERGRDDGTQAKHFTEIMSSQRAMQHGFSLAKDLQLN